MAYNWGPSYTSNTDEARTQNPRPQLQTYPLASLPHGARAEVDVCGRYYLLTIIAAPRHTPASSTVS